MTARRFEIKLPLEVGAAFDITYMSTDFREHLEATRAGVVDDLRANIVAQYVVPPQTEVLLIATEDDVRAAIQHYLRTPNTATAVAEATGVLNDRLIRRHVDGLWPTAAAADRPAREVPDVA